MQLWGADPTFVAWLDHPPTPRRPPTCSARRRANCSGCASGVSGRAGRTRCAFAAALIAVPLELRAVLPHLQLPRSPPLLSRPVPPAAWQRSHHRPARLPFTLKKDHPMPEISIVEVRGTLTAADYARALADIHTA